MDRPFLPSCLYLPVAPSRDALLRLAIHIFAPRVMPTLLINEAGRPSKQITTLSFAAARATRSFLVTSPTPLFKSKSHLRMSRGKSSAKRP